jgi:GNAT superfamily N-acetyltransferase
LTAGRHGIRLRPATQEDIPAMVGLQRATWEAALAEFLPEPLESPAGEWEARLGEALATQGVEALLADRADALAGLVVLGANRDSDPALGTGEIRALFVSAEHWRAGVGRALVSGALGRMAAMGYTRASLWSLRDNGRANLFYERLGFSRDGATQSRSPGVLEVRYAREIGSARDE